MTSEGDAGFYLVLAVVGRRADALLRRARTGRGSRSRARPGFLHDPYLDHHPEIVLRDCRVPDANRVPEGGGEGAREWFLVERLFIAARCCGAAQRSLELAREYALEREAFGTKIAEHQGVSFQLADSLTELLAARLLTYHAASAFDSEPDRKVVHGKVAMAKLYASEAAGRIVDRALQVPRRPRLHAGEPGRALLPRGAGRPHLGGHERDPAPHRLARPPQARRRDLPPLAPGEPKRPK